MVVVPRYCHGTVSGRTQLRSQGSGCISELAQATAQAPDLSVGRLAGRSRAVDRWRAQSDRYLAVPRNRCAQVSSDVRPDRVIGALPDDPAAAVGEVTFEVSTPHAVARSIVTCSACPPPMGGSRPSSRYEAIISCAASRSISRASSTVRPQVTTAGHSANWAIVQPFSSGVKTAVSVIGALTPSGYARKSAYARWPQQTASTLNQSQGTFRNGRAGHGASARGLSLGATRIRNQVPTA